MLYGPQVQLLLGTGFFIAGIAREEDAALPAGAGLPEESDEALDLGPDIPAETDTGLPVVGGLGEETDSALPAGAGLPGESDEALAAGPDIPAETDTALTAGEVPEETDTALPAGAGLPKESDEALPIGPDIPAETDEALAIQEPTVVTDGLVMHLDAGDSSSYSGSGQTWSDLEGNYDWFRGQTGSSEGSDPTFNGTAGDKSASEYFSTDGGDRFTIDGAYSGTLIRQLGRTDKPFSLEYWVYLPAGGGVWFAAFNTTIEPGIYIAGESTVTFATRGDSGTFRSSVSNSALNTDAWHHVIIAAKPDGSTGGKFYINGADEGDITFESLFTSGDSGDPLTIWALPGGSAPMVSGARVAIVRLYDRILTAHEAKQNWIAQKGRFGN